MKNIKNIVLPEQLDPATTEYPDGQWQDYEEGIKPGTPLIQSWYSTVYYFFRALLNEDNQTPNGDTDGFITNQPMNALSNLINTRVDTETDGIKDDVKNQNVLYMYDKIKEKNITVVGDLSVPFNNDIVASKNKTVEDTADGYQTTLRVSIANSSSSDYLFVEKFQIGSGGTGSVLTPTTSTYTDVAIRDNGSSMIAVGVNAVARSYDFGVTWVEDVLLGEWTTAEWSNQLNLYVAVKTDYYAYSADGVTWTEIYKQGEWTSVACANNDNFSGKVLISDGELTPNIANTYHTAITTDLTAWEDQTYNYQSSPALIGYGSDNYYMIDSESIVYSGASASGNFYFKEIFVHPKANLNQIDNVAYEPRCNCLVLVSPRSGGLGISVLYLDETYTSKYFIYYTDITEVSGMQFNNDGSLLMWNTDTTVFKITID